MAMQRAYDVIVIGLGAMGSATLYQLAKRGAKVLGIDQYRPPHTFGSTHGESRITRLATGEGAAYVPFAQRSHAIWRELESASGETLLTLSGGLILCPKGGGAQFHGQGDFVEHTAALARAFAIDHEVLDAAAVRVRWPQLRITDREHAYFEPTGGIVAVEKAVATQIKLAEAHGAAVHLEERVTTYTHDETGVTVTTEQGSYRAAKVVLSAGPWITDFLPAAQAQALAVYRQAIYWFAADDPVQFDTEHFPFLIWIGDTAEEFYSAFPYEAGGTVGLKMVTEEYLSTVTPATVDRTVQPHEIERMYNELATRRINGLRPELLKTGVCLYTNTLDEHFLIDYHPASERVLVASPCSGHGFKHSAAIGETLAQLALEGQSTLNIDAFRFARRAGHGKA
jgi:sarcosine oxidase